VRLGAMASGASEAAVAAAELWGHEVGMVFQLTDDILDLVATDEFLGKPAGSDIGEGTFTLPVLLALRGDRGDEVRALLEGGKPYDTASVSRVIEIVREGGHVQTVLDEVHDRIDAARNAMAALPSEDVTKVFRSLADYLIDRVDAAMGVAS
ncbi:polyprenyl synthetase family protein, partial [bacterium]|nr:polyprenyl synthetase family protein [bacterium]